MAKRILAVDDDSVIREIVRAMLQAEGFDVSLAENGEIALAMLEDPSFAKTVSLILLDKQMPGMTGFDVATRIKSDERLARIPIVMLTAEDKPEDIMSGYGAGAEYYITKPFTREQLLYGLKLVFGRL